MKYNVFNFNGEFSSKSDVGKTIFAESNLTVEAFHLKKDTTIVNRFEEADRISGNHVINYLVIEGKIEVRLDEQKVVLKAGEAIAINFEHNFAIWALEDSNLFGIHNCVEPEVDNSPKALVNAVTKVEKDDLYLQGHNYRVAKYTSSIMQILDPQRATVNLQFAAAYHDVGKVAVPQEVLNKQGRLTDEEFAQIKAHPALSYEMLQSYFGKEVAEFARWHHEKLDGSGYPDGISGDRIPLESRVMAVADIFDALTTDRCYRSGYSFTKALSIIAEDVAAGKLDESAYLALKKMIDEGLVIEGTDNMLKDANSMVHYDGFTFADIRNALSTSGTGMWKLEAEPGKPVRFYGDEIMNDLIGVRDDASPEDRMKIFMSRINPEDKAVFMTYYDNLKREQSEIIYRYDHPTYGTMYVRCGGKCDDSYTDKKVYRGFHQNINATVRIEEQKRRLLTENAEFYQKMAIKMMESMATSAMCLDLVDRSYRWIRCTDDRLNNIERYGDMGRKYSSYMPEEDAAVFMQNASMDNLAEVFKSKDEFSFSVRIHNEQGELRRLTMWYSAVDDEHRHILAISRDTTEE